MFTKLATGSALIGLSLAAWACGGGDSANDTPDAESVTVVAENTLFSPEEVSVPAGREVTLKLENRDTFEHDLEVEGLKVEVLEGGSERPEHGGNHDDSDDVLAVHTQGSDTATVTFMADEPGVYDIYCTIRGHREAGMVGTLTVE